MVFSRSGRSIFPLLPPYGTHDPNNGQIIPLHPDGLTPYLGLRARLSQVWINRWTILLLLVLVRVLIAIGDVRSDMASAKREALSACTSVESMGSAMASMPHYLSDGTNELVASGIEKAVNGLGSMLMLTITGVEEIILFILKIMYQTYLCLITMAVRATVSVSVALIEDVADAVNSTLHSISSDIQSTVSTFEHGLNDVVDLVNSAASALGANIPTLNLNSSISALDDWTIPSSFDKKLNELNSSIPTFSEVQNFTENLIKLPFEEVKHLINNSLGTYTFDRSALSVPAKKQLTFCNDNDGINSFFDGVTDVAITARKVFIIVLVIAAVLACVPMTWQEIRRWRQMKERSELVRKEAHDPMDVVYIVSRPYTAAAGIKAASRFSNSRRQILVRWAIAYATSVPALFVLSIAIAALLSCLFQYILLRVISKTVPELTSEVGAFADKVVDALQNASAEWANDANSAITGFDDDLNKNVFGWVNTSTHAVNETLNAFVEKTQGVLNETFGGTLLYEPIEEVFNCLVLLKITGVQRGLTWVSDHAHIDFPLLPNDTFSRGAAASISNTTSDPSDSFLADADDETSNKITEVVVSVINKLEDSLRTETLIATMVLLLWVVIVLIGFSRSLILCWGRDRNRGEGGGHAMDPIPNNSRPGPGSRGFDDVPLTAIPKNTLGSVQAVPKYETPADMPAVRSEPTYKDEKLGFAGQRDYDTALQVDTAPALRRSNYVEYNDTKG
ncbi:Plasma membrane fusion protein prm1 [Penicillium cinerascens]|uniref:Plasma membrane fusion protein PRM1 n=1 Tax=Penicillium cinerascens TaxID=70096 RepID=A0A9W9J4Z9_9EURO|nr:Plasma membrane fusion protein prm1 [Penicillium cinerascens]KAJ5190708.1 Plasma membrane fusion protein prm1 [Penicillium cinerascens]